MQAIWRSLLLLLTLASGLARGQVITGTLHGTVRDESGARLPEASLTLTSPSLIEGSSVQVSNGKGQFRFLGLEPGIYRLEVELEGFAPYREEGIRIRVGGAIERNIALPPASFTELVVVTGEGPLVDTREFSVATNYSSLAIRNTPVLRDSLHDFIKMAPGVSASSPTTRTQNNVSVLGAGANESTYLLDGTDITSPRYGVSRSQPGSDAIEEVEIQSFGASAEYGNLQGGVLNVVTRQGSNRFRANASYFGQWPGLTSQPILEDCDCPAGESGYERDLYRDFSAYAGGPLVKNRAWLYGGYYVQWSFESQPGADPRFPTEDKTDGFFAKLNWQITPGLNLMSSFHYDDWSFPRRTPNQFVPFESTATRAGDSRAVTVARLTHVLSSATFWEARVSLASHTQGLTPNNGSLTEAPHLDLDTGAWSGGAPFFGDTLEEKTDVRAKLSHYASDFLASDHDFKFGIQFIVGKSEGFYGHPGGAVYLDNAGDPFLARYRDVYSYGGAFNNVGVFAEDTVRVGERLTLNLGLRYDYNKATNPDVPAHDELGNPTGTVEGRGHLYTWNVLSPRLGFNWKITGDGRTTLRGFYGRFHPGILTTELQAVSPGIGPITLAAYDPATGSYPNVISATDPLRDVQVDPNTSSPHTNQYSIGIDRTLGRDWAVGLSYVRRTGGNFTGWEDVGGVYGRETVTLEDGRPLEVFPLLNDPADRLFLLTNRGEYFIEYDGLLLTVQKRWADRWQASVSYSYSKADGLQSQNGTDLLGSQGSLTTSFNTFGRDPNDLTNATGTLPNDRTHMFRVQGSVQIPGIEILLGASFQHLTGRPYAAEANVALPQGVQAIYIEPLGSRRISSQNLLDLRVSKVFRLGRTHSLEVLVDVLNALNDTAEESIVTRNFFSDNFAVGQTFLAPRRAMIGVRFSY